MSHPAMSAARVFDVSDQVVFITGASSGLGEQFAKVLAANGAKVALAGRNESELARVASTIGPDTSRQVCPLSFDITDHGRMKEAYDEAESKLGPITALINNAGIAAAGRPVCETSFHDWRRVLEVDLDAAFALSRIAAARMKRRRSGTIVNVSSIMGLRAMAGGAAYSVAKAGLTQLSAIMALELAPSGVRVNTLAPGYTVTNMNWDYFARPESRVLVDQIPLGRVGQVDDFDGIALFLISDASRFVTGAVFVVDGGHALTLRAP